MVQQDALGLGRTNLLQGGRAVPLDVAILVAEGRSQRIRGRGGRRAEVGQCVRGIEAHLLVLVRQQGRQRRHGSFGMQLNGSEGLGHVAPHPWVWIIAQRTQGDRSLNTRPHPHVAQRVRGKPPHVGTLVAESRQQGRHRLLPHYTQRIRRVFAHVFALVVEGRQQRAYGDRTHCTQRVRGVEAHRFGLVAQRLDQRIKGRGGLFPQRAEGVGRCQALFQRPIEGCARLLDWPVGLGAAWGTCVPVPYPRPHDSMLGRGRRAVGRPPRGLEVPTGPARLAEAGKLKLHHVAVGGRVVGHGPVPQVKMY